MKVRGKFWFSAIVVMVGTSLVPSLLAAAEDSPSLEVAINEIAWAGSTVNGTDEWIELKNLTDQPKEIGGWHLIINTLDITLPADDTIPADGFYLIAKYKDTEPDSALNTTVDLDRMGKQFSIPNGGFTIVLKDAADVLVDQAWDGSAPPDDGSYGHRNSTSSASIERKTPIDKGEERTSWQVALTSNNFDDSNDPAPKNYGTPKLDNPIRVEPPTLISISPTQAELGTSMIIKEITGSGFSATPAPTVKLVCSDKEITATDVQVASSILIDGGTFDLNGSPAGLCDLTVTNPDTQMALLVQVVALVEPPEQYDLATTVRINEVYPQPNTTSNDEFIELYNLGEKIVNLNGWILDDAPNGGSSPLTIKDRIILPKSYLTIYKSESKLTLNDSGDSVYLIQPNGFELDRTSYLEADRGRTWARFDDGWKWTSSPTPNGKNALSEPPAPPAEPPPAVDEPDDAPTIAPTFKAGDMMITELLPNPEDTDEYIELFNASNQPIDLKDWKLQDKSKRKYKIGNFEVSIQTADGLTIQPQQYVVITGVMSGIALNNTGGETVFLSDPAGNVIATASYPDKAPVGAAYVLAEGIWTWSHEPTPGEINVLGLDEADEAPPAVDVVLPAALPVTGRQTANKIGLALVGLALGAILGWSYVYRRYQKLS